MNPTFQFKLTVRASTPGGEPAPVSFTVTPQFDAAEVEPGQSVVVPFTLESSDPSATYTIKDANWLTPPTNLVAFVGLNEAKNAVVITAADEEGAIDGTIEIDLEVADG